MSPALRHALMVVSAAAVLTGAVALRAASPAGRLDAIVGPDGTNPHPVRLLTPPIRPLSALAQLGRKLFYDPSLSASGRQSCASCHDPSAGFGPPGTGDVQMGGAHLHRQGLRPPPSIAYLYNRLAFTIGPPAPETDVPVPLAKLAAQGRTQVRASKSAGTPQAANALVPQGGLFWDGRADTLADQATGPLLNPAEMANPTRAAIVAKLRAARYARDFVPLFGAHILEKPGLLLAEAMSALSAYQVEAPAFHRFDSKYDAWLAGKVRLSPAEARGLRAFDDPARGNCAACHISAPGADGEPPLFTDTEYEALGVPRNPRLAVNADPAFFDLGLCGPVRTDLARQTQYCGMFLTPTLRNVARRHTFFHNGFYHSLRQVLDFYNLRASHPEKIYPRDAQGRVDIYNDLPAAFRANIDTADAPFDAARGSKPRMSARDISDIIAFLKTLNDGYTPRARAAGMRHASSR